MYTLHRIAQLVLRLIGMAALCSASAVHAYVGPPEPIVPVPEPVMQLNENCVVSVLNRTVQVAADGTWVLPNIPANFGEVRARATCVQDGVTSYGESDPFLIPANLAITLPRIYIGARAPIPTNLRLLAPILVLPSAGATVQLQAMATFPGSGTEVDVTATGTAFSVSNPTIATVTPAGLVTALRSGTVVVQALKEGTQGIVMLRVLLDGADSDGDGIPDADEVRLGMNPNNAVDASLDQDLDNLTALQEYQVGTDPRNRDTDGDTLPDGDEVGCIRGGFCTSPLLADTDGDGIRDATEIATGTDPTNAASFNLRTVVASLRVNPPTFTLVVNSLTGTASVQLNVIGTMIDGYDINLTSTTRQTTYASNNLASCNFGSPDGRVYASAAGTCTITVTNNGRSVQVAGTVRDFVPSALSFVSIPGYANAVAVSGNFAFVAAGSAGLQVVNLSADRRTPAVVAALNLGTDAYDVAVVDTTAYVATNNGLKVVDVATPTAPIVRGSFTGISGAMGVKVLGATAYVAAGGAVHTINIADPAAMSLIGSLTVGESCWNLDVDSTRNLAAVACIGNGLKLVDIGNLAAPRLLGTVPTSHARGVALRGNAAVVADYADSMTSVDITNPQAPVILSRTTRELGGLLNNVVLSENFALGADAFFVNGVPIVDVSNPLTLQPRTILNFPARDDNGLNIAVDGNYVYLAADLTGANRGGSSGDSRLYIGQFRSLEDLAGVPPTASITSPANGSQVYEGAQLTVTVNAVDDFTVAEVQFLVNGSVAFTSTTAPYTYTFTVPTGVGSLVLGARAMDLGSNVGVANNVTVAVAPDPLTRVVGRVVRGADDAPLQGALVSAPGGRTGTSGADGRFQIDNVPTVLGNVVVQVQHTASDGVVTTGSSNPKPPVLGGTTDVGLIDLAPLRWETDFGTFWSNCDRCAVQRTLPFSFPFYGENETVVFVSAGGYINFGEPEGQWLNLAWPEKVMPFCCDIIYGGSTGGVYINSALPDRFVVTYYRMTHIEWRDVPGPPTDTFQVQLYKDGRIVFAYNGINAWHGLGTGTEVALTPGLDPGGGSPFWQSLQFADNPSFEVPPLTLMSNWFDRDNPFNLDNGFIEFTPKPGGGYRGRVVLPPPAVQSSTLTGGPAKEATEDRQLPAAGKAPSPRRRLKAKDIAHAEVIVRSSRNPRYIGMTNTDAQGRFTLHGVPAGAVYVQVRRNGRLLARGAGLFAGDKLNRAQLLNIDLVPAELQPSAQAMPASRR